MYVLLIGTCTVGLILYIHVLRLASTGSIALTLGASVLYDPLYTLPVKALIFLSLSICVYTRPPYITLTGFMDGLYGAMAAMYYYYRLMPLNSLFILWLSSFLCNKYCAMQAYDEIIRNK